MMKKVLAVALAFAVVPAWAINRCTGPDGKVQFQDGACTSNETSKTLPILSAPPGDRDKWNFEKSTDSMTGKVSCLAFSPEVLLGTRVARQYNAVRLTVHALPNERFLATADIMSGSRDIFHNDLAGMGIRSEPGSFLPLDVKLGQKMVGGSKSGQAIDELLSAKFIKLRLRFWPYDDLVDSPAIATVGLRQAIVLASQCARASSEK